MRSGVTSTSRALLLTVAIIFGATALQSPCFADGSGGATHLRSVPLFKDRTEEFGTLTIDLTPTTAFFTYSITALDSPWVFEETHLVAVDGFATSADDLPASIPRTRSGNMKFGRFPYETDYAGPTAELAVGLAELALTCGSGSTEPLGLILAVGATVTNTLTGEEAGVRTVDAAFAGAKSWGTATTLPATCDCVTETCSDGLQNQGEEGIDCGGPCAVPLTSLALPAGGTCDSSYTSTQAQALCAAAGFAEHRVAQCGDSSYIQVWSYECGATCRVAQDTLSVPLIDPATGGAVVGITSADFGAALALQSQCPNIGAPLGSPYGALNFAPQDPACVAGSACLFDAVCDTRVDTPCRRRARHVRRHALRLRGGARRGGAEAPARRARDVRRRTPARLPRLHVEQREQPGGAVVLRRRVGVPHGLRLQGLLERQPCRGAHPPRAFRVRRAARVRVRRFGVPRVCPPASRMQRAHHHRKDWPAGLWLRVRRSCQPRIPTRPHSPRRNSPREC